MINNNEGRASWKLGNLGYKLMMADDQTTAWLIHQSKDLDGGKLTFSNNDDLGRTLSFEAPDGESLFLSVNRNEMKGSINYKGKLVEISEASAGSWNTEFSSDELRDIAVVIFAMKDLENPEVNELINIEKVSNSSYGYYSCKEVFVQGGLRKSAVESSILDEADEYVDDRGCTSSEIIGDVDCACVSGDFGCLCMTAYILEGCACEFSL